MKDRRVESLQLRVERGVPVLRRESDERPIALDSLPLPPDHLAALREWSGVAGSLADTSEATAELISRRGRQLAGRLAASLGRTVVLHDPVDGSSRVFRVRRGEPEPTPWATGVPVSVFAGVIVVFTMVVLALALGQLSPWLAFAANIVVTVGLVPTIVIVRSLLVWRWLAHGATVGIVVGWVVWFISLL